MNLVRLRSVGLLIVLLVTMALPAQSTRASTHTETRLTGQYEAANGGTTIWLRICGQGNAYWFRSAQMDGSILWNQAYDFDEGPLYGGCSYLYRSIVGTQPGGQFRLYSAVLDQVPADPVNYSPPLDQARLDICTVVSNGVISCTRQTQTVPTIEIDAPGDSQTVSGAIAVSGWAVDKASTSGPGVDSVTVSIDTPSGTVDLGSATYGGQRNDVATFLGDTRFTNSGYSFPLNTDMYNDGLTTIRVNARSTVTGNWTTVARQITIANGRPPTLTAISPKDIATNTTNIPFVLTGADFRQPVQVTIGGVTLSDVEVQNPTTIHGVLKSTLPPGQYDAKVTIGAKSSTLPKALTVTEYVDPTQFRAMVYMACDDEQLVTSCDRLFNQLELAMSSDPNLRIVVLWDGYGVGDSAYYLIQADANLYSRARYVQG
jgi:hypothetical protein